MRLDIDSQPMICHVALAVIATATQIRKKWCSIWLNRPRTPERMDMIESVRRLRLSCTFTCEQYGQYIKQGDGMRMTGEDMMR